MSPRKKRSSWQSPAKEQVTLEPPEQGGSADADPAEPDIRVWDLLVGAIFVAILVIVAFAMSC
ncbi:MAG: hypothetical protein R6U89_10760 [Dehalococcoidia bacterium]